MSVADDVFVGTSYSPGVTTAGVSRSLNSHQPAANTAGQTEPTPFRHRLAEVRKQQGVSVRSAARRMGVSMDQVRREEHPETDLMLSDLVRWQVALEVPLADLLTDDEAPISAPILKRAKWLRLMKTVKALGELEASSSVKRMAAMLESQVVEIMPELADVGAWHSVGQRRTQDELGRIAEDTVPTSFARDGLS